jgi:hypothetical protein
MPIIIEHFKTNVLLKDIIGQQLINDDNIAVLELVKNSIDAKATQISITFSDLLSRPIVLEGLGLFANLSSEKDKLMTNSIIENIKTGNSVSIRSNNEITIQDSGESAVQDNTKLIIQDDGHGMDLNDLRDKWLNIAYSEKRNQAEVFAGDKGVGRFSCDRLGEKLNIYTKKKGQSTIYHLCVNWVDFERANEPNLQIQDIDIEIKEINSSELQLKGFSLKNNGTILEITQLRSNWDKEKLFKLKENYLGKLINAKQTKSVSHFTVDFVSKDFPHLNGNINSRIFEKLKFNTTSIESFTEDNGQTITTILMNKGQEVLKIKEKNPFFIYIKDIKISLYYLNPYAKTYFAKQTGERSVNYGSIMLFKNGFRILPYGNEENDWLGLEKRKGQGYNRYFGTRELFGRIELNDNQHFVAVSSREGLVENDAFNSLASKEGYIYLTMKRLENYVVDGLKWDRAPNKEYTAEFEKKILDNKSSNIEELFSLLRESR